MSTIKFQNVRLHTPGPAVAGEIEKLEGEDLPALVEELGDIVNPEEESAAATALSVGARALCALAAWTIVCMT